MNADTIVNLIFTLFGAVLYALTSGDTNVFHLEIVALAILLNLQVYDVITQLKRLNAK